jgi:hypothetical protein
MFETVYGGRHLSWRVLDRASQLPLAFISERALPAKLASWDRMRCDQFGDCPPHPQRGFLPRGIGA